MPISDVDRRFLVAVGAEVQQCRRALGWTQADLADRIGVQRTSITNIERGRQNLPITMLYHIAQAFGVQAWDLLPDLKESSS